MLTLEAWKEAVEAQLDGGKKFTPVKSGGDGYGSVGVMLVTLSKCGHCKKTMVFPPRHQSYDFSTFPIWHGNAFTAQVKRAGWVIAAPKPFENNTQGTEGQRGDEDDCIRVICVGCAKAGHATFVCRLCDQKRPTSQRQDSTGSWEDRDSLCTPCYETVPAKEWDKMQTLIGEEHRYDHC